jgi:hypothetical protein
MLWPNPPWGAGGDGVTMPGEWANDELSSGAEIDPSADLRELEDEIARLSGIHAVRVVGDRSGRPIEVHILADNTKPPKQTVRDVRAVAQTLFGWELDHRIVSVAQLKPEGEQAFEGEPAHVSRVRVVTTSVETVGVRADVRVVLADGDTEYTGYAEGSAASIARPGLVAAAALDALRQINRSAEAVHIASAEIGRTPTGRVALVTAVYVDPQSELVVSGSAVVRRDRDDAVARAVLDATNRRLGRTERGRAPR